MDCIGVPATSFSFVQETLFRLAPVDQAVSDPVNSKISGTEWQIRIVLGNQISHDHTPASIRGEPNFLDRTMIEFWEFVLSIPTRPCPTTICGHNISAVAECKG